MSQNGHTPSIHDIEAQKEWELSGVERGAKRVRDAMDSQNVGDSELGVALMRHVAPRLINKIANTKRNTMNKIVNSKGGRLNVWEWLITLFKPEQLAVIVLKGVLSKRPRDFTFNIPVAGTALTIARYAQDQLDYEDWKKSGDDTFQEFLRANKQINRDRLKRFSERINRQRLERWDHKSCIIFGAKLIDVLVEACPEWFSIETTRLKGGRLEAQIVMSEEAKETMANLVERCELSRPMMLPMICQPAEWRRV